MQNHSTPDKSSLGNCLDHLVVAARNLQNGVDYVASLLGVPLEQGGQHLLMGTHNALLRFDDTDTYLEVIAVDPSLPTPQRNRWFGLDNPQIKARLEHRPQLLHWVARTDDILLAGRRAGFPCGQITPMTRGHLHWQITVNNDGSLPGQGILPSLIQWPIKTHPAQTLPSRGCRLRKLMAVTPEVAVTGKLLADLQLEQALELETGDMPALRAWIETPQGVRLLE